MLALLDQSSARVAAGWRKRSALLGVLAALFLAVFFVSWWIRRPAYRYQAALDALAELDLVAVDRQAAMLSQFSAYAEHAHLLRGALCLRTDQGKQALTELALAFNHPDTRVLALTLAGECLYRMREYKHARQTLEDVLKIDPRQVEARRWLSCLYWDIGARKDALDHLKQIAALAPGDGRPHRMIGLIYMDFKDHSGAAQQFQESLRRDPNPPYLEEILLELAEAQVKTRQYAAARATLAKCRPSAGSLALEAECHYGEGQKPQAHRAIGRALELSANHLEALLLQGRMALESGDAATAVRSLSRACEAHPKDYFVRFKLAQAYRLLGETGRAEAQLRAAEDLKAIYQSFRKLHFEAVERPLDAEVRYQIGLLARQLDEPADGWFQAARALDPNHKKARLAAP